MSEVRPAPARMRPAGTKLRNIRVQDELWRKAKCKAERLDTSISEVLRKFLDEWVE